MHSLKPHTETLQTLRRLVIRKDMKKATPTLNCSVANIHDTPALLHVVSVLENSQLVDTYPTLFLEYGQILGMQATAQTDNLKQLLEKMQDELQSLKDNTAGNLTSKRSNMRTSIDF